MINNYLIDENISIIDTMRIIDEGAHGCAFVCVDDRLVASVSDGDIRRYIMNGGSLTAPIKEIANYKPKYKRVNDEVDLNEYMRIKGISALPILDEDDKVVDIVFYNGNYIENKGNINVPVVVMAGGKGTRLYPYTKILPKPLIPIGDTPILEIIMDEISRYNCNDFYLIVNHKKNMIKTYFNETKKKYGITYIDEEKPLGTGGGLSLLKGKIKDTFILTNCDIIIRSDLEKIYRKHKENNNLITMVCCNKPVDIPYGVVEISDDGQIISMEEKPRIEMLTNTGMYFVDARIIEELEDDIAIGFPDIIMKYKNAGEKIGSYVVDEDEWLDMGQIDGLEHMSKVLR